VFQMVALLSLRVLPHRADFLEGVAARSRNTPWSTRRALAPNLLGTFLTGLIADLHADSAPAPAPSAFLLVYHLRSDVLFATVRRIAGKAN